MTRCVYTDIPLPFTLSTTTFPTIAQTSAMITNFYKLGADILTVTYTATVPDTPTLFALIVSKLSIYIMRLNEARKHPDLNVQISPDWLTFTDVDKQAILGYNKLDSNENSQNIWID
jgi:hypothetical protein